MNASGPACWYVSRTWGVHDQRWVAALEQQGFSVTTVSLDRDDLTDTSARQLVASSHDSSPIIIGPLDSLARSFTSLPNRVIGLSWGFDLVNATEEDVAWLPELDHVIVDSVQTQRIAHDAGLSAENISVIPWGVDLSTFTPNDEQSLSPVVLSLRAHEPRYRVADLFDAWPDVLTHHESAQLLIGNDGSLTKDFKNLVRERGLESSVRFIGRRNEKDLPELLRSATTYVSTSPIDGTSVTMLQAMACGVPVVVTDTENNRSWITPGESGYLFESGNTEALAQHLNQSLAASIEDQQAMTTKARASVLSRADWTTNTRKLREIVVGP